MERARTQRTKTSEAEQPVALVVEAPASAGEYLDVLEQQVGLRWILTNHFETFRLILERASDPVQLVVLDFRSGLTEKLKFYMQLVRSDPESRIPALLLPSVDTREQAVRMVERPIDQVIVRPFATVDLQAAMGAMMRRSRRQHRELRIWLMLEERMVEGRTTDLSSSGLGAVVPDPILFAKVRLRLFAPAGGVSIDIEGHIRRKQRLSEGGYQLGIQFLRVLEGDPAAFGKAAGVDLGALPRG